MRNFALRLISVAFWGSTSNLRRNLIVVYLRLASGKRKKDENVCSTSYLRCILELYVISPQDAYRCVPQIGFWEEKKNAKFCSTPYLRRIQELYVKSPQNFQSTKTNTFYAHSTKTIEKINRRKETTSTKKILGKSSRK